MSGELKTDEVVLDALRELVNIGMGRAAASISEITARPIGVDVPVVEVLESFAGQHLPDLDQKVAVRVTMPFVGDIRGHGLLVLSEGGAGRLVELLMGHRRLGNVFDEDEQSALLEVGNITLNCVIGLLLNELHGEVEYQIPQLHLRGFDETVDLISDLQNGDVGGMLIRAGLRVESEGICGYLMMLMQEGDLETLLTQVSRIAA
ncbi:chemotaxis protein CheC [Actomonas aquatica]|uniref:Chemotaxis protein CheC n=1 Tax=Actomonas aquatica TaxID=2866162 RepID=A0ABZ1C5P3_9BACT|nr:chemotaxis protein CheC [Opitutus sp. WL0086]WRQ86675.1 chemotaxis protein CheC [Opitutus sp. WL0086]